MIVFFDLETGGILPTKPDIQIAAIATNRDGDEVDHFNRLIEFREADADADALALNHYDAQRWDREAKPLRDVMAAFAAWLKRHATVQMISKKTGNPYMVARLAAYNSAFDAPRLQRNFQQLGMFLPAHPQALCVMQRAMWAAQESDDKPPSFKLADVCRHHGIVIGDEAHDALADVRAAAKLAKVLGAIPGARVAA